MNYTIFCEHCGEMTTNYPPFIENGIEWCAACAYANDLITGVELNKILKNEQCKVVHCKKEPYDIYIGRPSKFGNKFIIGKHGNREEVIKKYEAWLNTQPDLIAEVKRELKGKILGCWCSPLSCHGDVLARIANE